MVKAKRNINVEICRVEGDLAPFVKVDYVDKYAEEHTGLMVMDTGSNVNVLSSEVDKYIGDLCRYQDSNLDITDGLGGVEIPDYVHFSFAFGGMQYNEDFAISGDWLLGSVGDLPIIGILGNNFMQKHGLAIDYSDFTVHTSNISHATLCAADCDFMFPMEIGLENYGLPVLAIHHGETDAAVIADTGCTTNVVSTHCINQCNLKCEYTNETSPLRGLNGRSEANVANVHFNLLTLAEDGVKGVPFHDFFLVVNQSFATAFRSKKHQPIEGLIGSPFMAKRGWTLDFAQKVIYKRKR